MRVLILAIAVMVVSGCSTIAPNFSSKSCYHKVAASEVVVTEAMNTLLKSVKAGLLDKEKSDKIETVLDTSKELLDSAETLCPVETRTAFNLLGEVQGLVDEVNALLGEKNG